MKNLISYSALVLLMFFGTLGHSESGVTESEILLGSTSNLTGVASARAVGANSGAKVYFDKLNASGGINGRKIHLITYDDQYKPDKAAFNAEKLAKEDKVFAYFQPYGTAGSKNVSVFADRFDIPLLFPFTGASAMSFPTKKNVFSVRTRYSQEAADMVAYAMKKGWKKIALYGQNNEMGADHKGALEKHLDKHGLKLVAAVAINVDANQQDYDAKIDEVIKAKPDVIIDGILGKVGVDVLNRTTEKGFKPVFFCFSPLYTDEFPGNIKNKGQGLYLFQSSYLLSQTNIPVVAQYLADSKAAGVAPHVSGVEGYINAKVTALALEKAGKNLTRDSLRKALENDFNGFDVGGLKITFSPDNHQGANKNVLMKAEGDKLVAIE
jgi:ABC-type branched-subunit amino acid transport system substrate-binding protein